MARAKMNAMDTVSARLADCYVTIDGERYNFMQAISLEAKAVKKKVSVPILGRLTGGNKAAGMTLSGKARFHRNTSIFNKVMQRYKDKGEDIYFDIQVVNEDPTSSVGRQEIMLYDCNIDSAVLTSFDAEGQYLTDELEFTFEDWDMTSSFSNLNGML
jgi:hypothetical protein